MSKPVQHYECDECHEGYADKADADACERRHVSDRERYERDAAWTKFDDEYSWQLTVGQIQELTNLAESWFGRSEHPQPRRGKE